MAVNIKRGYGAAPMVRYQRKRPAREKPTSPPPVGAFML